MLVGGDQWAAITPPTTASVAPTFRPSGADGAASGGLCSVIVVVCDPVAPGQTLGSSTEPVNVLVSPGNRA